MEQENIDVLKNRITDLEKEILLLHENMIHDPLTGLKTRAFFEEELGVYLSTISQGEGKRREWFGFRNLSVIFFDIDHFKIVNDTYGHDSGDMILKKVAETIRGSMRTGDTAARWGGEEIIVSLLGASEKDAVLKAEEIRVNVEKLGFPSNPEIKITVSAGVAASEKDIVLDQLVKKADEALYRAKNAGRNKIVASSEIQNEKNNTSS